ncbi:MAG: magnesium transporter CorA family protein [Alphaproteobacteria bacterium]|nr:magnesium transporter CorA family protein [Alphaproteobacteria bacterium]
MLSSYTIEGGKLLVHDVGHEPGVLRRAVWIDMLNPTQAEAALVEQALALELPTREEMQEIESSSRLYREGEVLFLTAPLLHSAETAQMATSAATFVLAPNLLVTIRYATPKAFGTFSARAAKSPQLLGSADGVMLGLFEQIVDRLADILERLGTEMDRASHQAFVAKSAAMRRASERDAELKQTLITLGRVGEVTSRISETLLGLSRILTFVGAERVSCIRKENQPRIKTLVRDVRSLVEHGNSMTNKATFLLDATLGVINIEQMAIIKTFTVVSVAMMPPTLIASIYGMNFRFMPELGQWFGYPLALLAMLASALLPIWYFRRRGWL